MSHMARLSAQLWPQFVVSRLVVLHFEGPLCISIRLRVQGTLQARVSSLKVLSVQGLGKGSG